MMTRLKILVPILLMGLILITGCNNSSKIKPATTEELSQMNRDFVKALNDKDAVAAANCYTEDATLYPPNEGPVTGRDNIQKYWEGAIAAGVFEAKVASKFSGSNGNLGYEVGRLQMKIPMPDGTVLVENGKYTEILKRGNDGKWRSAVGIWNMDNLDLN